MDEIKEVFLIKYWIMLRRALELAKLALPAFIFLAVCMVFSLGEDGVEGISICCGTIAAIVIYLIHERLKFLRYMHLVEIAFQDMEEKKRKVYAEKIKALDVQCEGNSYIYDELLIYEADIGLVPIQYKNIKKIVVLKKDLKGNKVITYKLKQGFPFKFNIFQREDFIEQLIMIKSYNEDIPIVFKSRFGLP